MNIYMVLVLLFLFIFAVLRYHLKRISFYKCSYKLPGPPAWPIIGNALWCIHDSEDVLKNIIYLSKKYGTLFRFWLGTKFIVFLAKPTDLEVLLNNCTEKEESLMKFLRPFIGNGLITANSVEWKIHRKIINPTFNLKILNSFIPTFVEYTNILIVKLKEKINQNEFDISEYISLNTLDFICDTTMGLKMNTQTEHSAYAEKLKRALFTAFDRMTHIWSHIDRIFYFLPVGKQFLNDVKVVQTFAKTVMKKKMQEYHTEKQNRELFFNDGSERKAFLEHLLELKDSANKFTDAEIFDEINTFIAAGTDTISTVISFTCFILGSHADIQEKVYEEVLETIGDCDKEITNYELSKLQYLEQVLKETMRLFPPTPLLVRRLTKDLKLDKCILPKKTTVIYANICTHRDPEIWPEPLKFDPDRFLSENVIKRHPYAYYPFGAGLRNCIGSRYAMISMKTVLAILIRNFKFKSNCDIHTTRLETGIVLKPVLGYLVSLESRKK